LILSCIFRIRGGILEVGTVLLSFGYTKLLRKFCLGVHLVSLYCVNFSIGLRTRMFVFAFRFRKQKSLKSVYSKFVICCYSLYVTITYLCLVLRVYVLLFGKGNVQSVVSALFPAASVLIGAAVLLRCLVVAVAVKLSQTVCVQ